jgi:hypothetical protein
MRQLSDKPNGVGNENRKVSAQLNAANQRVERGKQSAGNQCVFFGERAEKGRLARIRISDQRDERKLIATSAFAMKVPMLSNLLDLPLQRGNPMADLPAIHFQLRFTRTARSDSAAKPGEIIPVTRQSGESVCELGEFDLKFSFLRAGSSGEDIENQTRAVDNFRLEDFFQIFCLAGRKLLVENNEVYAFNQDLLAEFFNFSSTDVCCRVRPISALNHLIDDACAGSRGQLTQFIESVIAY